MKNNSRKLVLDELEKHPEGLSRIELVFLMREIIAGPDARKITRAETRGWYLEYLRGMTISISSKRCKLPGCYRHPTVDEKRYIRLNGNRYTVCNDISFEQWITFREFIIMNVNSGYFQTAPVFSADHLLQDWKLKCSDHLSELPHEYVDRFFIRTIQHSSKYSHLTFTLEYLCM